MEHHNRQLNENSKFSSIWEKKKEDEKKLFAQ